MPNSAPFRTRFAPSPTGRLHPGNARAALFSWLAARKNGGEMLLRIEDTDSARGGAENAAAAAEDLKWLGLNWAGEARRQSENAAAHGRALDALFAAKRAYWCFCPPERLRAEREEMLRAGKPPRYSGRCAALSESESAARIAAGEPAAARFRMPPDAVHFTDAVRGGMRFSGADIGDFILRRADGGFSFFFANAVDDSSDGISLVLRGEDHLSNTPRQLAVLSALGMRAPEYGHFPLLSSPDGGPLSKREGAGSLAELRGRGFLPAAVLNYLARAGCGLGGENLMSKTELALAFSPRLISKSSSIFDFAQLLYWQKRASWALSDADFLEWSSRAFAPQTETARPRGFALFCAAARENIVLYEDAREWGAVVESEIPPLTEAAAAAVQSAGAEFYKKAAAAVLDDMEWKPFCGRVKAETGCAGKNLFMPLRAALTGRTDGPEMPPLFKLIGAEKAKKRLESVKIMCKTFK